LSPTVDRNRRISGKVLPQLTSLLVDSARIHGTGRHLRSSLVCFVLKGESEMARSMHLFGLDVLPIKCGFALSLFT
jgi:hypothetical protein